MKEQNKKLKEIKLALGENISGHHRNVYQDIGVSEVAFKEIEKRLHEETDHVSSLHIAIDASTNCLLKCYKKLSTVLDMTLTESTAVRDTRHGRQPTFTAKNEDPIHSFLDLVESKLQLLLEISNIDIETLSKPASSNTSLPCFSALDIAILGAPRNVDNQTLTSSASNIRVNPRLGDVKTFAYEKVYRDAVQDHEDNTDKTGDCLPKNTSDALLPGEAVVDRNTTKQLSDLIVSKAKKAKMAQRQKGKKNNEVATG
jgi:hypothetical protein